MANRHTLCTVVCVWHSGPLTTELGIDPEQLKRTHFQIGREFSWIEMLRAQGVI